MDFDVDSLQQHIPPYLTAEDKQLLVDNLKSINQGGTADYFINHHHYSFRKKMLQGDGWRGFQLFQFETGRRKSVKGIILSNSCDVDPSNLRDIPGRVIFAPLVEFSDYKSVLEETNISTEKIQAKIDSIKAQKTTNIFFLPGNGPLKKEYVVHFDTVQSMPLKAHLQNPDREKLFTLSNVGFYMLTFKLSIHFCRLHENVNRKNS